MFYTHGMLDRADHLRKDEEQQTRLFEDERAHMLPVWRGRLLVGDDDSNRPTMLSLPTQQTPVNELSNIFLGLVNELPLFSQSISDTADEDLSMWTTLAQQHYPTHKNIRFDDLRVIGPALNANEGALMAYARGLTYWHDSCQFCSRCGGALQSISAGHVKRCSAEGCGYHSFPRTDSAVIMLVTQPATGDSPARSLLGRSPAWPPGVFSTLAGFVETGESLEQAVKREVLEEANITTKDVRYVASQPWPFPRSIMLGFEATATSTEITCDPIELEDARWFTVEQIKKFGTWGDEGDHFKLPRPDSIARFLIDRWVARHDTEKP